MNLSVLPASCRQKKLGSADETSAARCRAARTFRRFMVPMRAQNEWRLPMNRLQAESVLECGGKRSATPLLNCLRSSLPTKAPSSLRSAGALQTLLQ